MLRLSFVVLVFFIHNAYAAAAAAGGGSGGAVASDESVAGGGEEKRASSKLMGIEVETSAIKLRSPGSGKLGFIIGTPPAWMIEEDTQDNTFEEHEELSEFNRNMEFKTIGGHGKDSIIAISADIEKCALKMYESSVAGPFRLNPAIVKDFLAKDITIVPKESDQGDFIIKSKSESPIIRLQITYQIPLEGIHRVFKRLRELDHGNVKEFLYVLDPSIPIRHREPGTFERMEASGASPVIINSLKAKDKLQKLFREKIMPVFHLLEENRLKGFMYLFIYYWYEIFNNKDEPHPEPGVKPWLAIMSRVPLSQVFDSLEPAEQAGFRTIMEPIIVEVGGEYKIRDYADYDEKDVLTEMNVRDWYFSIVEPSKRQKIKIAKKLEALSPPHRKVDLLSPPLGLDNPPGHERYSMGSLDLKDSSGFPLLEVRGYSSIRLGKKRLTIMDISSFVTQEARWFYD